VAGSSNELAVGLEDRAPNTVRMALKGASSSRWLFSVKKDETTILPASVHILNPCHPVYDPDGGVKCLAKRTNAYRWKCIPTRRPELIQSERSEGPMHFACATT